VSGRLEESIQQTGTGPDLQCEYLRMMTSKHFLYRCSLHINAHQDGRTYV